MWSCHAARRGGQAHSSPQGLTVADHRVGDEDKDEDEISSYAVLLTASVERFGVSCMRDFFSKEAHQK